MEIRCNEIVKLKQLSEKEEKGQNEMGDNMNDEDAGEGEGRDQEEAEGSDVLEPQQRNLGFSAFGARPISCELGKTAGGRGGARGGGGASGGGGGGAIGSRCEDISSDSVAASAARDNAPDVPTIPSPEHAIADPADEPVDGGEDAVEDLDWHSDQSAGTRPRGRGGRGRVAARAGRRGRGRGASGVGGVRGARGGRGFAASDTRHTIKVPDYPEVCDV